MSAPGGRATRSRFSSPYTSATKDSPRESAESGKNGDVKTKRGVQDEVVVGWQEPPIPQPRPSFAEAGMERHGVVANMAALGTRPSAKIMKGLLKGDNLDGSLRRSRRETSVASTPAADGPTGGTPEATQTPDPTQTPEVVAQNESDIPIEDEMIEEATLADVQEEHPISVSQESYVNLPTTPQQSSSKRFDARMSLPLNSPVTSNNGSFPSRPLSEPYSDRPTTTLGTLSQLGFSQASSLPLYAGRPSSILPTAFGSGEIFMVNIERTDSVIEHAVQAALDDGRLPTAYALRTLYDDKRGHVPSVQLIEAVYGQYATPQQLQEFNSQITARKREGKKDRVAEYYFNGEGSDFVAPPRQSSLFSPSLMPSFSSTLFSTPPFATQQPPKYRTPYSPLPTSGPPSGSLKSSDAPITQAPVPRRSTSPVKVEEDQEPPAKKRKANDFEAPEGEVNGDTVADEISQMNGTPKSIEGAGSRSRSASTSSSLSSLNEDVLNTSAFNSPAKTQRHGSPGVAGESATGDGSALSLHQLNPELAKIMFPQDRKEFISPYASKENFEKLAETVAVPPAPTVPEARITRQPIKKAPKAGPKTFLFSIHKPTSNNNNSTTSSATTNSTAAATGSPSTSSSSKDKTLSNKKNDDSNTTSQPTSTTTTRAKASMAVNSSSTTTTTTTTATTPLGNPPTQGIFRTKGLNKVKAQTPPAPYDANDATSRMRRRATERTNRNNIASESFERHQAIPLLPEADSDVESVAARPTKKPPIRVRLNTRTRNNNYDSEDNSSPTALAFQPELAPGSVPTSRAGTPNNLNRAGKKGRTGSGLRIKTSPMKKKGGILAGLSRPSGERNSPSGGTNGLPEDNDDYCSSCGGNGSLVCCDGCTRSFHYQCVDPPMIEDALPEDPWFCNVCQSSRQPPPPSSELSGAFGSLLFKLNEKNPSAFQLPLDVRESFEGVKTGAEGEYEDIVPPKSRANRPGWEEQPDYFRTRDAKGNLILCYQCNSSASAPDRKIIPCSFCTNHWHLDCLPNPLAKEPGVGRQWRCPLHVDDLLSNLPAMLAPAHRFRKLKGTAVIRPAIQRGTRNNGHIEIENEASADEEDVFYEHHEFDKVYKLSDRALKLDFISKAKQMKGSGSPLLRYPAVRTSTVMSQHTIEEQQAALNMAALASQPSSVDNTSALISALLAQATPATISLIARGDGLTSQTLSQRDRQALLTMKALIEKTLGSVEENDGAPSSADVPNLDTPPKIESRDEDTEMLL